MIGAYITYIFKMLTVIAVFHDIPARCMVSLIHLLEFFSHYQDSHISHAMIDIEGTSDGAMFNSTVASLNLCVAILTFGLKSP